MEIIEPLRQEKKLVSYLDDKVKKVGIVFWHGLGDCVQFLAVFNKLKKEYPNIHFDILLQNGLGQEVIYPEAILINDLNNLKKMDYDYIFLVHFPVEGGTITKSELSAKTEIGVDWSFPDYDCIPNYPRKVHKPVSKLIGIHYQNTALPNVFNPTKEVAEKIWNEVLEAGYVPIELDFTHVYHNPANKKFDFIDCTVRRVKPSVDTLLELILACRGVIAVVSGPLHCALAMAPEKVFFLEKNVPIERFITCREFPKANVNDYKGEVREWLQSMHM